MTKTIKVKRFMSARAEDSFNLWEVIWLIEDWRKVITIKQEKSEDWNDWYFMVVSFTLIKS